MLRSESRRSSVRFSGSCAASMPAAAQDASVMAHVRSSTVTRKPLAASSRAVERPMIPAPAITTSAVLTLLLYGGRIDKKCLSASIKLDSLSARLYAEGKVNDE